MRFRIAHVLIAIVAVSALTTGISAAQASNPGVDANNSTATAPGEDKSSNDELKIGVIDRYAADGGDLTAAQQIRPGQWLVSSEFDATGQTVELAFYSEYAADMAIADSNDVGREGTKRIDVTNFDIDGGEVVVVRADASIMTDIAGISADQTVTVNSFDSRTSSSSLAAISVSDDSIPLINDAAQWSFVWVAGAGVVSLGLFAVLLAFLWHWFRSPKDELDLYDMGGR